MRGTDWEIPQTVGTKTPIDSLSGHQHLKPDGCTLEILQQLRRPGRAQSTPRGSPATLRLHELRDDPLPESEARAWLRSRVGRPDPAVPPRDRTTARLLDRTGRFHGKRRVTGACGGA